MKELHDAIQKFVMVKVNADEREGMKVCYFRNSFLYKVRAFQYHQVLIGRTMKGLEDFVENQHSQQKVMWGGENERETRHMMHAVEDQLTSLMEDYIYHLMSAIDNLTLLLRIFYKNASGNNISRCKGSLVKHQHSKGFEVSKFLDAPENKWVFDLYSFRGDIYHEYSKTCRVTITMSMSRKSLEEEMDFKEYFSVCIPEKLKQSLGYPAEQKEVNITDFCEDVSKRFAGFSLELFKRIGIDNGIKV